MATETRSKLAGFARIVCERFKPASCTRVGTNGLVGRQVRTLTRIEWEGLVAIAEQIPPAKGEPVVESVIDLHQEIIAVDDVGNAERVISLGTGNVLLRLKAGDPRAKWVLRPTARPRKGRQLAHQQSAHGEFQAGISGERGTEKFSEEPPKRNGLFGNLRRNALTPSRFPRRAHKRRPRRHGPISRVPAAWTWTA
jgi:hypothetical protein